MRKIIAFENITVDGFMSGPKGEIDWAIRDEEVSAYAHQGQEEVDTFFFGRVTYDMMANFWPTPAGKAANPVFANTLNNAPKIVVSKNIQKANWEHTSIMSEISVEGIMKLKQSEGKNIMIFGSGQLVDQLTNLSLIDEYELMINPVILGKGKLMFSNLRKRILLRLIDKKPFKSGILLLHYGLGEA